MALALVLALDLLLALYVLPVSSKLLGQNAAKILFEFMTLDLIKLKEVVKAKIWISSCHNTLYMVLHSALISIVSLIQRESVNGSSN